MNYKLVALSEWQVKYLLPYDFREICFACNICWIFRDKSPGEICGSWNDLQMLLKVISNATVWWITLDFLLAFHGNCGRVSYRFHYIMTCWLKIANFHTLPVSNSPRWGWSPRILSCRLLSANWNDAVGLKRTITDKLTLEKAVFNVSFVLLNGMPQTSTPFNNTAITSASNNAPSLLDVCNKRFRICTLLWQAV